MTGEAIAVTVSACLGVTGLVTFLVRLGSQWGGTQNRLDVIERQLRPNGHATPETENKSIRDLLDIIHQQAQDNGRVNQEQSRAIADTRAEVHDLRRFVNKLSSDVDIYTNAVLTDRRRIRAQLREAGINLPDDVGDLDD